MEIETRVGKLEAEIQKYKKTTIIALVFSIICGGGGLVGLATWISSMPKQSKELAKMDLEAEKIEMEMVKDSLDISMRKFNDFKTKYNSEVESISRQLELFKSIGSSDKVEALTALLIDKEHQFQDLIATTSEMCEKLAFKTTGNREWAKPYVNKMDSIRRLSQQSELKLEKLQ